MTHEQIAVASSITRCPTITTLMSDRPFTLLNMKILEPLADWLECDPYDLFEIIEVDELPSA